MKLAKLGLWLMNHKTMCKMIYEPNRSQSERFVAHLVNADSRASLRCPKVFHPLSMDCRETSEKLIHRFEVFIIQLTCLS